jgi:calcium-dependent protein kinase
MHRDLKPSNIICDEKYGVVVVDFGFACKICYDDSLTLSERIGTPFYMSPELLHRKRYNSKSDIWSLGVIYYEMLCGSLPFFGINDGELYKDITTNYAKLFKN